MLISECKTGEEYIVTKITANADIIARAKCMGIYEGAKITLLRIYRFGGAIIYADSHLTAVGKELLRAIEVER